VATQQSRTAAIFENNRDFSVRSMRLLAAFYFMYISQLSEGTLIRLTEPALLRSPSETGGKIFLFREEFIPIPFKPPSVLFKVLQIKSFGFM
jgi:hypothetical protein